MEFSHVIKDNYQKWPKMGKLNVNMNKKLNEVEQDITSENSSVDIYILRTIKLTKNMKFIQTGSGPNFQGGILSQCTCRPDLRARRYPKQWENRWIAGFTTKGLAKKDTYHLVYLMKIHKAFESIYKIFFPSSLFQNDVYTNISIFPVGSLFNLVYLLFCPFIPKICPVLKQCKKINLELVFCFFKDLFVL